MKRTNSIDRHNSKQKMHSARERRLLRCPRTEWQGTIPWTVERTENEEATRGDWGAGTGINKRSHHPIAIARTTLEHIQCDFALPSTKDTQRMILDGKAVWLERKTYDRT